MCDIVGAAYTYYKSLSQEESIQRRGKMTDRKKIRRRRERITRVSIAVNCGFGFHNNIAWLETWDPRKIKM